MRLFISDLHFNHDYVAKLRGFKSHKEHDLKLLNTLKNTVKEQDELFILGDISLGSNGKTWRDNLGVLDTLKCTKHLVLGNHDRASATYPNGYKYVEDYLEHYDSVSEFVVLKHGGEKIFLSHYPYDTMNVSKESKTDNSDEYSSYSLRDTGHILIHGHTHYSEKITESSLGSIQYNVGVDSIGMKPKSLSEIYSEVTKYRENNEV